MLLVFYSGLAVFYQLLHMLLTSSYECQIAMWLISVLIPQSVGVEVRVSISNASRVSQSAR
jgi:hypothetical protein